MRGREKKGWKIKKEREWEREKPYLTESLKKNIYRYTYKKKDKRIKKT